MISDDSLPSNIGEHKLQGGRKMILGGGAPFKLKTSPPPFLPSHLRLQFQGLNNKVTNYK